jgi:hypothetical protein
MSVELKSGTVTNFEGWVPVDALIMDGMPTICWMDMRNVLPSEPFFHQTIERMERNHPQLTAKYTGYDALIQSENLLKGLKPSGFIFHSSRSGSTVLSNALKVLPQVLVCSEPYVLDKLIGRLFTDVGEDKRRELIYSVLVRAAVNALGQPPTGAEQSYFIKFSSISVLQFSRIWRIWPDVPALFMYRDPIEVIVSNLNDRPSWMDETGDRRIHSKLAGCDEERSGMMSREEFCARAVGSFYHAALTAGDSMRLFNYKDLCLDSLIEIMEFFRLEPSVSERSDIAESLANHAKDVTGRHKFQPDSARKQQSASRLVIEMAERWAFDAYYELERNRKRQIATLKREGHL